MSNMNKDKRPLNDEQLAQVAGGIIQPEGSSYELPGKGPNGWEQRGSEWVRTPDPQEPQLEVQNAGSYQLYYAITSKPEE